MANREQKRAAKAVRRKAIVRAKRQAETIGEGEVVAFVRGPSAPGLPPYKASAALLEVAEPLTDDKDELDLWRKKLTFTMFAWNLSLLPLEKREQEKRKFFANLVQAIEKGRQDEPRSDRDMSYASFDEAVTTLIKRKTALYPFDRRRMMELEVLETPHGFHVNVVSELDVAA